MTTTAPPAAAKIQAGNSLFLVPDVVKTAEYYRDVLGFQIDSYYGDPPCFVFVRRDCVEIMLKLATSPEQVHPNGAHGVWDLYFWITDIQALRSELRTRGAKIVAESPETFYHTREIEVEDCNGFRLCFAMDTSKEAATEDVGVVGRVDSLCY